MTRQEVISEIRRYDSLSEGVIKNVEWMNFGTRIKFIIEVPLFEDKTIEVCFNAVQYFCVINDLTTYQIEHLDEINWGFSEVALIKYEINSDIVKVHDNSIMPFHHVAFLWENERRIDVVFQTVNICEYID